MVNTVVIAHKIIVVHSCKRLVVISARCEVQVQKPISQIGLSPTSSKRNPTELLVLAIMSQAIIKAMTSFTWWIHSMHLYASMWLLAPGNSWRAPLRPHPTAAIVLDGLRSVVVVLCLLVFTAGFLATAARAALKHLGMVPLVLCSPLSTRGAVPRLRPRPGSLPRSWPRWPTGR